MLGLKWKQLTDTEKDIILSTASPIDGITCNRPEKSTDCIINFDYQGDTLSVSGYIEITDEEEIITIDNESIIYNGSAAGILDRFRDRLREVYITSNLTQKQVAEIIGCSKRSVEYWLAGEREPEGWIQDLVIEKLIRSCM